MKSPYCEHDLANILNISEYGCDCGHCVTTKLRSLSKLKNIEVGLESEEECLRARTAFYEDLWTKLKPDMKVFFLDNSESGHAHSGSSKKFLFEPINELKKNLITVDNDEEADMIVCGNLADYDYQLNFFHLVQKYKGEKKFYGILWDCYIPTTPQGYHELFSLIDKFYNYIDILVPNFGSMFNLKMWFPLLSVHLFNTFAQYFDVDKIEDKRYAVIAMRDYEWDISSHWPSRAFKELDIPYVRLHGTKTSSFEQYKEAIANCSFLISSSYEASTGGLALLEGLYHGKPLIITDSPMNGANDIFRGTNIPILFKHASYEDMKEKIIKLWENPLSLDNKICKEFCSKHSVASFARSVLLILSGG